MPITEIFYYKPEVSITSLNVRKMNFIKTLCAIFFFSLFIISCNQDSIVEESKQVITPQSAEGDIIPDQYIVNFKSSAIPGALSYIDQPENIRDRETKAALMEENTAIVTAQIKSFLDQEGISEDAILYVYTAIEAGAALRLTEEQFKNLQSNPTVNTIEFDRSVSLPDFTIDHIDEDGGSRAQTTPCGITNAGGAANAGTSRWIWVVDTGIDLDHPDLNVVTNSTYAKSYVGGSPNDCNGHGTHCAGTAAARNNSFGVVGVAANAPVVPIRVLNCGGSGSTSGIIAGLNHVATYDLPGDVVNMSLGGYYGGGCANGSSYKSVIQGLGNAGTRVAIAAGNSAANAAFYQPACVNGNRVYTVSSMTCGKSWSSFSNYNMNPVDYIATGSSVYSTYLNGGYATLSGTSMATPHVAGICQIRNNSPRSVGTVYKNGEYYPIAKR